MIKLRNNKISAQYQKLLYIYILICHSAVNRIGSFTFFGVTANFFQSLFPPAAVGRPVNPVHTHTHTHSLSARALLDPVDQLQ